MLDIGPFHPMIVHFVVALLVVGVIFRLISLTGRLEFTKHAATALILLGTLASVAAVKSGDDAHGPAERVPGAREAVEDHEHWGERTRNLFLGVAVLELLALAMAKSPHQKKVLIASGALGIVGLFFVYETGEHGGEVVYAHAGGVGTRSGEPEDVQNLLVAGLYHQAMQDREAGRPQSAARLIDEMARRLPDDTSVQLLQVQSLIEDRKDGDAALAALERIQVPADNPRARLTHGLYTADAYVAAGLPESARSVLRELAREFPDSESLQARMEQLGMTP